MTLASSAALRLVLLALAIFGMGRVASAAEALEQVQRSAGEWARLREETVRLETDWSEQRAALEAALAAQRARVEKLTVERDAAQAAVARESLQFSQLETRTVEARAHLESLRVRIDQLAARLEQTRPSLPPRLSAGLELPFASIRDPKLGPSERMQHLVTILNRCAAFNKALTVVEEELALGTDGARRVLDVVYLGLSHAYALDTANRVAYLGTPGPNGWAWQALPDAADDVARLVAIHRETADPAFSLLPLQVVDPFGAPATP